MTDELRAAAERISERDLANYQGPTGDDADMRAGIVLARAYLAESDERDNLLALLREVEWKGYKYLGYEMWPCCPICENLKTHQPDCRLAAALKGAAT